MEFFTNPNGSLFKVSPEEYSVIMDMIRGHNPAAANRTSAPYDKEQFLAEVFLSPDEYEQLARVLKKSKNLILQGAPGTGKTFTAKRLAYAMMGTKDDSRIRFVQFHQNYSYEDFVMGYKPEEDNFRLKTGIFYEFCKTAESHPTKDYFFIIDEINRGNISKIFGELLMLIESSHRGEYATLTYNGLPFAVPKNLYLIGMMNTADRSLAMIDYALRRRFFFYEMEPAFHNDVFKKEIAKNDSLQLQNLIEIIQQLNDEIEKDPSLGRGFRIGHSYFCNLKSGTTGELADIVDFGIVPMLEEYWFDDADKVAEWKKRLEAAIQ
jgi:5-methylcytosine-specific restriction protein B